MFVIETEALIHNPAAILATLAGVAGFFFWLEKATGWKFFNFVPPLIFIYLLPAFFSNVGITTSKSPVYGMMSDIVLPMFLTILLLNIDVKSAVRVMGRGVFVMLIGTAGVIIGAPLALLLVKHGLGPEGWKAFAALSGSWVGGTGNMAAAQVMWDVGGAEFGLAVIGDNAVYLIWLPIMLGSKNLAGWFHKFTGVKEERINKLHAAAEAMETDETPPAMRHYLYLIFFGLAVTAVSSALSQILPTFDKTVSSSTWQILLVTTFGIALSFTKARTIPGSHNLAMALVYIFVANMGARSNLAGVAYQAGWFLLGAYIWIFIHGAFILLAARFLRVDVHTAAISSAANIGGAASAPIVAAYHNESLVPVSILMALIGYAIGNYAAYFTGLLCQLVSA